MPARIVRLRGKGQAFPGEFNELFTRSGAPVRQAVVYRILICLASFALPVAGADPELHTLLKTVENHYNRAQSLKLTFSETYTGAMHLGQPEAGTLWLRKPGRMFWDYSAPAGKMFLSDGKDVYLYTPDDRRAEKSKLNQSVDMRAPLAFLLGKLDFEREFKNFQSRTEAAGTWIIAEPKSASAVYSKVEFQTTPQGEIRQVRITGQDQSRLNFIFSGEQLNVPVAASMFTFHPPPGVNVIEASQ